MKLDQEDLATKSISKPFTPKKPIKPSHPAVASKPANYLKTRTLEKPTLITEKEISGNEKLSSCRARLTSPGPVKTQLKINSSANVNSIKSNTAKSSKNSSSGSQAVATKSPNKPPKPLSKPKSIPEIGTVFKITNQSQKVRTYNLSTAKEKIKADTNLLSGSLLQPTTNKAKPDLTDSPPLMTKLKSRYNSGERRTSGLAKVNKSIDSIVTSNNNNKSTDYSTKQATNSKQDHTEICNYPKPYKPSVELLKNRFNKPNQPTPIDTKLASIHEPSTTRPTKSPKVPALVPKLKDRNDNSIERPESLPESLSSHRPRRSTSFSPAPCLKTPVQQSTKPPLPRRSLPSSLPLSKLSQSSSSVCTPPSSFVIPPRTNVRAEEREELACASPTSPLSMLYDSLEDEEYEETNSGPKEPSNPCPSQRPLTEDNLDNYSNSEPSSPSGEIYEEVKIGNQLDNSDEMGDTTSDSKRSSKSSNKDSEIHVCSEEDVDNYCEYADISGDEYECISDIELPPSRQLSENSSTLIPPTIVFSEKDKSPNKRHIPLPATPNLSDSNSNSAEKV